MTDQASASVTIPANIDQQTWPNDDDPNFWRWIRQQFLIPHDEAYFNTGTLGARPHQVVNAVINHMREIEESIAHYDYKSERVSYIAGYNEQEGIRRKAGIIIHASEREIALTQNATMGLSFLANGLDLQPGDEILITDQEHEGGRSPWELRAKRSHLILRKLPIPVPPLNPQTIIKIFTDAVSPHTRIIAIPHITPTYGIVMPVREICELARQHGIFTVIDGAQSVGQLQVNVTEIGCDAYVTSPHKWLFGPPGTGLLYIREEQLKNVWTTLAGRHWDNNEVGAFRLMQYGTANLSLLKGLEAAMDFHLRIGSDRIEKRDKELADQLRSGLQQLKGVTIQSPLHPALTGAIVTYGIDGLTGPQLQDELWTMKNIRVRSQNDHVVRQCIHIYNSLEEIDATLAVVKALANR